MTSIQKLKQKRDEFISRVLQRLFPQDSAQAPTALMRRMTANWKHAFERLLSLGGASSGNHFKLWTDGDDAFFAMLQAIASAKRSVWLETYIFESDAVGSKIRDALTDAAAKGVQVRLIYDHFGSSRLNKGFWHPLLAHGGKVHAFNPIWPWRRHGPLLFRDHRKILIVDEKTAFCGGLNISADYAGQRLGTGRFRDTLIEVNGPAVHDLAKLFLDTLHETSGEEIEIQPQLVDDEGAFAQVLASNTRRNLYAIQRSMEVTLKQATQYCYITSPYFLPFSKLKKAMIKASGRGVDVRVLTAGLSDVPLMRMASQHVYGQFLKAGIRIYEMYQGTLHAKTATIDGVYGTVGSYNLDHWSARRNLEVNVSAWDPASAEELKAHFEKDLQSCHEVSLASWEKRSRFSRLIQWIAYQIMRL